MDKVQIRRLQTFEEILSIMQLQQDTWGKESEGGLVPAQMLIHLIRYGGHVLAAYAAEKLVGFIIGYIGLQDGTIVMASKRMVVAPPFRNQGIAIQLKHAQRALAIEQGISLITWTFAPTMSLNAHFNLNKLGAVCRRFDVDVYGRDTPLSVLGNSDRLVLEYGVNDHRVLDRLRHAPSHPPLAERLSTGPPILNPSAKGWGDWRIPIPVYKNNRESERWLIELPANFDQILENDRHAAIAWQTQLRQLLLECLNRREHLITDLWFGRLPGESANRAFYLLERELEPGTR